MNFLAHHFISILPDNYYYNLGLTFVDILSLQHRNCKITDKKIDEISQNFSNDDDIKFLLKGMKIHLQLDKWFHNSEDFYLLLKKTSQLAGIDSLPVHQLVEILLDIYIDKKNETFAKSLIKIYNDSRLEKVIDKLKDFCEIKIDVLKSLCDYIGKGEFYRVYLDDDNLIELIKKLAIKIKKKKIEFDDEILKLLINNLKIQLEKDYEKLYNDLIYYSGFIQKELLNL